MTAPTVAPPKENRASFLDRFRLRVRPRDLDLIEIAYNLAKAGHSGATRDDGITRRFEHSRQVVLILVDELEISDPASVIAGLHHDIPEDTYLLTVKQVGILFGPEAGQIVDAVTKRDNEHIINYIDRIIEVGVKAIILKLADNLHNLRTLGFCTKEKQLRKAAETKQHYLPLISRVAVYHPAIATTLERKFKQALETLEASTPVDAYDASYTG